jgi:hypothetical protein
MNFHWCNHFLLRPQTGRFPNHHLNVKNFLPSNTKNEFTIVRMWGRTNEVRSGKWVARSISNNVHVGKGTVDKGSHAMGSHSDLLRNIDNETQWSDACIGCNCNFDRNRCSDFCTGSGRSCAPRVRILRFFRILVVVDLL